METKKGKEERDRSESPKKPTTVAAVDPSPELTPHPQPRTVTPPPLGAAPHPSAPAPQLPSSSTKKTDPLPDFAFSAPTAATTTVSPSSSHQEPRSCVDDYSLPPDAAKLLHATKQLPVLEDINTYRANKMLLEELDKFRESVEELIKWGRELLADSRKEEGESSSADSEEVIKQWEDLSPAESRN